MQKIDKDTKNILLGITIGGILGIGAASFMLASKKHAKEDKTSSDTLGKIVSQFGEVLSDHQIKKPSFVKGLEKELHKHENTIGDVLDIVSSGLHLWNTIKKGK